MSTTAQRVPALAKFHIFDLPFNLTRGITQALMVHGETLKKEPSATRQSFGDDFLRVAEFMDQSVALDTNKEGMVMIPIREFAEVLEEIAFKLMKDDSQMGYLEMVNKENIDTANEYGDLLDKITNKLGTYSVNIPGGEEQLLTRLDNLLGTETSYTAMTAKVIKPRKSAVKSTAKKSAKRR